MSASRRSAGLGRIRAALLVVTLVLVGIGAVGCGRTGQSHAVLDVPGAYPTIQAAVDHAKAGDLILISPGVYDEAVVSHVPDLVIRGTDRSTVILDGRDTLSNGITLAADGDVVENLTVRHYGINGILFTLLDGYGSGAVLHGYRASYVTAYDNGLYGFYAFGAENGEFDHDDASGQPDSGIYVGQCNPCHVLTQDSSAESNRVGFEAANASGGLTVITSDFARNRAGIVVDSDDTERLLPQVGGVVAGNVVVDNDNPDTPIGSATEDVFGDGIVIGGGSSDQVLRNRVSGNSSVGILVTDAAGYTSAHDTVTGNALSGNAVDLVYVGANNGPVSTNGNCFTSNDFRTSEPDQIQTALSCGASTTVSSSFAGATAPVGVDYTTIAPPPLQAGMPSPTTSMARPATDEPPSVNIAAVALPAP